MMVLHCDRCGRIIEKKEEVMSTLEMCAKKYDLCSDCTSYLKEALTNGKENK